MYHTKLPDIIKSKEIGFITARGYDCYVAHNPHDGTVTLWDQRAGSWPFFTSGLADHDNPDEKRWVFADTVDVYIDETTGASIPIKMLNGKEVTVVFANKARKPLTYQDIIKK